MPHYKEVVKKLRFNNPQSNGISDLSLVKKAISRGVISKSQITDMPKEHISNLLLTAAESIPFVTKAVKLGLPMANAEIMMSPNGDKYQIPKDDIENYERNIIEKVDNYRKENPKKALVAQIAGTTAIPGFGLLSKAAAGLKGVSALNQLRKGTNALKKSNTAKKIVDLAKNSKTIKKIENSEVLNEALQNVGTLAKNIKNSKYAQAVTPTVKKSVNILKKGSAQAKKVFPITTTVAINDALQEKVRDPYSSLLGNAALNTATYNVANAATSGLMQKLLTGKTRKFIKELGARNVKKSIASNKPLIDVLDDKGANYLKSLKINRNLEAENILAQHAKDVEARQYKDINNAIERSLGNTSTKEAIANMQTKNEAIYKPLYEKLVESGTALKIKPGTKLFNMATGSNGEAEVFGKYMSKVPTKYRNAFGNNMPQNQNTITLKVLDKMQKDMADDIHKMKVDYRGILPDKARLLIEDRNKLISAIDEQVPEYAKTREVFHNMRTLQDKVLEGRDFGKSGEGELKKTINKMTGSQKDAYQVGVREKLLEDLDKVSKNEGGNIYAKLLNDKTLRDLEAINIPKFNEIKAQSIAQRQALDNLNRISGFSQPQYIKPINPAGAVVMPNRYKLALLDRLFGGLTRKDYTKMAQAVTSPDVLNRIVSTNESLYGKTPTKLAKNIGKYAFLLPRMFIGNDQ
ncbi:hypothetical protein AGMMS49592_0330 [Endomicrobiia bacterium]|nr:hypothetical protein AGMMS49592_0330 [Endomicrobiia bacterium]